MTVLLEKASVCANEESTENHRIGEQSRDNEVPGSKTDGIQIFDAVSRQNMDEGREKKTGQRFVFFSAFCNVLDHQACDELCKVDNFWYGYCIAWDGKDFSCKCFDYHPPLDGKKCEGRQEHCSKKCLRGGSEGGFCYPQKDTEGRTNRTGCECFKELPPLLRRRKRGVGYKRQVIALSTTVV
uniref:WSC domain-containing protein n=1 Tax=Heterorhabditis bacteriophora TaxID=37862 RepID=A0A1I7XE87_HETBA